MTVKIHTLHLSLSCLLLSLSAFAQIQLGLTTDRENYILYEDIQQKVTLRNNSGTVLNFGGKDAALGHLKVDVYNQHNERIPLSIDARSHFHFLTQTQPRLFSYWIFDPNGKIKKTAHYMVDPAFPIPRMIRDPDIGRVMVVGGVRAKEGVDYNEQALPVMRATEVPGLPDKLLSKHPDGRSPSRLQ